jgi:hypothetical protein
MERGIYSKILATSVGVWDKKGLPSKEMEVSGRRGGDTAHHRSIEAEEHGDMMHVANDILGHGHPLDQFSELPNVLGDTIRTQILHQELEDRAVILHPG